MSERKGVFELLVDFSFKELVTTQMVKLLYGLHLFLGLVAAIGFTLNGFRVSPAEGLLALVVSVIGFGFWVLYVRVCLETLIVLFRIAENTGR